MIKQFFLFLDVCTIFISFFTFIFYFFLGPTEYRVSTVACASALNFGLVFVTSQKLCSVVKQTPFPPKGFILN